MPPASRRALLASVGGVAAGLSGCFGLLGGGSRLVGGYRSYGYGPHNRGYRPSGGPTGDPSVRWHLGRRVPATPAVVGDTAYVVAGSFYGGDVEASELLAVSTGDGRVRWRYELNGYTHATPAVANRVAYVADSAGTVHAVEGGSARWTQSFDRGGLFSCPVVADGAVVVGIGSSKPFEYGGLVALSVADGSVRWRVGEGRAAPQLPAVGEGTVYYARRVHDLTEDVDEATFVRAVSTVDATEEWSSTVRAGATGVAVGEDRLYLGATAAPVGLGRNDGTVWGTPGRGGGLLGAPAVGEGSLYLPSSRPGAGELRAFGLSDLSVRWKAAPWRAGGSTGVPSFPTVAGDTLYISGPPESLYALSTRNGAVRWRFDRAAIAGTPAVADGVVYAPSAEGLFALESA